MKIYFLPPLLFISCFIFYSSSNAQQPTSDDEQRQNSIPSIAKSIYIPPPPEFSEGVRTATFQITYNTYSADAQTAFQYAADIWASILISDVPIKINTYFTPLVPGLLGITLPNGRKDFPGAPEANSWYATSLANSISGTELNPGEFDVDLFLNSNASWYFGTDGNCPLNKFDFVSTALHEICHGLGFVGLGKISGGVGSFGLLQASDFLPIVTSFPWPDLDTLPGIYDHYLEDGNGVSLITIDNPSTDLSDEFTNNNLFWNGSNAIALNGGTKPRLYAPASFSLGSSLLHLDESAYPAGNINELMTPFAGAGDAIQDPGPITIGILKDIGWNVNYPVGIENISSSNPLIKIFPIPVNEELNISGGNFSAGTTKIYNALGQCMVGFPIIPRSIKVSGFSPGIYYLEIKSEHSIINVKFLKD